MAETQPKSSERRQKLLLVLVTVIALVLVGWALKYTRVVTMPLVFGFFVTLLVWPIYAWLRQRLPDRLWWLGLLLTMLLILLALSSVFGIVWYALRRVINADLEQRTQGLREQWQQMESWLSERNLPTPTEMGGGLLGERAADWAAYVVQSLTDLAAMLVLIFFFVLLMLLEADNWRRKTRQALRNPMNRDVLDAMQAASFQVRQFLLVQALVAFISAVAAGLWLWAIGVPFPLLWAVLTFLLDFVPSVGSILSGLMATAVALLALGWGPALLTAAGLFTIEQIMGNYVDPLMKAHRMEISPLIVLPSVMFWGWVWGAAGAVLAVPITATLIIVFAHIPTMRPAALMLSRTSDEEALMKQTHGDHTPAPGS